MSARTGKASPSRSFIRFALLGFLVAHVWEVLQMPFFTSRGLEPFERTLRCTAASVGDGLILGSAAWLASRTTNSSPWYLTPSAAALIAYFGFGLLIALGVEAIATTLPQESVFGWRYSSIMPMISRTPIALVPVAMWIAVPAATLALVRFTRS